MQQDLLDLDQVSLLKLMIVRKRPKSETPFDIADVIQLIQANSLDPGQFTDGNLKYLSWNYFINGWTAKGKKSS